MLKRLRHAIGETATSVSDTVWELRTLPRRLEEITFQLRESTRRIENAHAAPTYIQTPEGLKNPMTTGHMYTPGSGACSTCEKG